MKISKKLLTVALATFTFPSIISAATVEVNTAETLNTGLSVTGNKVVLTDNIEGDIVINEGIAVTLDLNGYTLTNSSKHTIVNSGNLTIIDSSEEKDGKVDSVINRKAVLQNNNNGQVILNGGTFTRSRETGIVAEVEDRNSYYVIQNTDGTVTINEGVTVLLNGDHSSMICNGGTESEEATMLINGGVFEGGKNTIKNDEAGILTINDGTFKSIAQATILNWNKATINGGSYDSNNNVLINGYYSTNAIGELTVNDGIFKGEVIFDQFDDYSANTVLNINGGKFIPTSSIFTEEEFPTLNIKGGVFEKKEEDKNQEETTLVEQKVEILSSVSKETKKLVEAKLPENSTVVGYYNIDAILKSGSFEFKIEELDNEIEITIDLPKTIEQPKKGYSRKYFVIREHNGVAEILKANLNKKGELEFKTNKFSSYAVTYVDKRVDVNPDTGVNSILYIFGMLASASMLVVSTLKFKKVN